jgi:hypothetical protein
MFRKKRIGIFEWVIIVAVVGLLVGGGYYIVCVLPRGELGQGEKWRILQYVELTYRENKQTSAPVIVPRSADLAYSTLGMPTGDGRSPFVWILLDDEEDSSEPVKMIPKNMGFRVDCGFVEDLPKKVHVTIPVLAYLRRNCLSREASN